MNVLGISGRDRDAAAALAINGRLVAAVSEESLARGTRFRSSRAFPRNAMRACLTIAGVEASEIQEVAIVQDHTEAAHASPQGPDPSLRHARVRAVDPAFADAAQAAGTTGGAAVVLVWTTEPPAIAAYAREPGGLRLHQHAAGAEALFGAVGRIARLLGLHTHDPYAALDRLSVGGEPLLVDQVRPVIRWQRHEGVSVDEAALSRLIASAGGPHHGSLGEAASLNVRVQEARRALAASVVCHLAAVINDAADDTCEALGSAAAVCAGSLFGNPRLAAELRRHVGARLLFPAIPETAGRVLGAALSAASPATAGADLPVGPAFSDQEIKNTLDACRLEYVYEPDWDRLFTRASKMLENGKIVAWFQGSMVFGPRAMGTRSVLCDPSTRFARENINEYLRQVPLDEPLPVTFAPSFSARCLSSPIDSCGGVADTVVNPEWREKLVGALDWRQAVRVHAVGTTRAPELCTLLEVHARRSGVPALVEVNLAGPGEPVACTPRDAVRVAYSSSVDALVMGRFLLMKDHWLLRSYSD